MATPKSQRIGIWIIAVVMLIGTIGSFVVMILANQNNQNDQAAQNKALADYQKQVAEEATKLSAQYYPTFGAYKDSAATFDKDAVGDKVTTNDLKQGDGADIAADTKYQAYYIGWNPRGKSFDSSFDGDKLKAPIDTSQTSLIEGWNQGVVGMKVGGIREITIPSDLAYGEKGSGSDIPANTPIKFIVMIIATK
ncbi:MAG: putative Peptidylprolyl isomerase [Candidatus Saccharibacteria bacterium]|nr:putative Peptidylprolyl isomerase [Candidatus Saccharibacteria bacterium]